MGCSALLYTNCYTLLVSDMNISEMIGIIIFNSKNTTFNMVNFKILSESAKTTVVNGQTWKQLTIMGLTL